MNRSILFAAGFVLASGLSAQHHEWSFSFGSDQYERAYGIELDPAGNVYVCGAFDNTVDFDPDTLVDASITEEGNGDVYLAKYDNTGAHLWSFNLGFWGHDLGSDMVVDDLGNIYLTGYFRVDVDFDPGPGTAMLTAQGTRDVFVAKYDTDGNYQWAFNIAFGGNVERYPGIGLDADGNVLVTGEFGGTQDFDPGAGTAMLTSAGNQDIFLAKYDGNGNFQWARGMGGPEFDRGMDVVADASGSIYVTGMIADTVDMDGGPGTAQLVASGTWDSFLAKYDAQGDHLWSFRFGGPGTNSDVASECGMDLALDGNGDVYVVGYYSGAPDMDPGPGTAMLDMGVENNGYIAKYTPAGAHMWSYGFADGGEGQANAVAVDPSGHVYVTGYFYGTADFDPGPGTAILVGWDFYTAKYTPTGDHVWSFDAGDTAYDGGWGIAVDDSANVYVTGVFYGTIDMDPDTGLAELEHVGGRDVFVAKYAPCAGQVINAELCPGGSYALPDGSLATAPGTYTTTFLVGSCDSVLVTDLQAVVVDTNVVVNGGMLTAAAAGATYQWVDCDNGNAPIIGEDQQSFMPSANGTYAVEVATSGCTVLSGCHTVVVTEVPEMSADEPVVFPNPAQDVVYLRTAVPIVAVEAWSPAGQRTELAHAGRRVDLQDLAPGLYHLRIALADGQVQVARVLRAK